METRSKTFTRDFWFNHAADAAQILACVYEGRQILATFQLFGEVKSATWPGKVNLYPHGGREKLENTTHWTRQK